MQGTHSGSKAVPTSPRVLRATTPPGSAVATRAAQATLWLVLMTTKRKAPEATGSVLLETAEASCEIGLFGGHVLSWKVKGEEQMFMSSKAIFDGGESGTVAIRGGVPICWPQFGFFKTASNAPDAKHGLIRYSHNWVATKISARSATLELVPDAAMKARWSAEFKFSYTVSIQGSSLRIVAEVANLSETEVLEFTGCLHTYWACENAADCVVEGLKGAAVDVGIGETFRGTEVEAHDPVRISGETLTEALYGGCTDAVVLVEGERRLRLTKCGWNDWVVWNVGGEKAPSMSDLGEGEYKRFVCIEPTAATKVAVVAPGATWVGYHEAERLA